MIETCTIAGCHGARVARSSYCNEHFQSASGLLEQERLNFGSSNPKMSVKAADLKLPPPPTQDNKRHGRRQSDIREGESSGGDVDYYRVHITDPKRPDVEPYMAEAEDIIEALGMTFAEGNAFKAVWRKAAQRTLGHMRRGSDQHGVRDSEKVEYYGRRMLVQAQREARKETAGDVRANLVTELERKTVITPA